jgi:hypothetical protein
MTPKGIYFGPFLLPKLIYQRRKSKPRQMLRRGLLLAPLFRILSVSWASPATPREPKSQSGADPGHKMAPKGSIFDPF